jgi:hypothetical protein
MDKIFGYRDTAPHNNNQNHSIIKKNGNEICAQIVCVYCDGKKDKYCMRVTMGGNLVKYPGDCRSPTADLITVKPLLNSIISMPHSKFMTLDHKDFYLMTPMK